MSGGAHGPAARESVHGTAARGRARGGGGGTTTGTGGWRVVVPVKPAAVGKSRLAVDGVDRTALARAVALDTIEAAARASRVTEVIVVTADETLRDELRGWPEGAAPEGPDARMPEIPRAPDDSGRRDPAFAGSPALGTGRAPVRVVREAEPAGLDAAVRAGLAAVPADRPRAVLLGDLPALRPSDLDAALVLAGIVDRGLVPDAEGTGTTLVTARASIPLSPAFGTDSAARHRAAGHVDLDVGASSTLRRDVDTAAQLAAALALGAGPRTAALLG
ncbi:2-phospho-L-lactate guanylyltransferase [Microbacterium betulae]|uniref:Phosphoenolpyruvate guanylyltransferase n=1 Tax=Microbacterium betulae TaxID=2981139 RepID=A0AA97FI90_9MICO|nr:2-phospho-L-lactate guanylyltransferase [Microbacterium sp. AB]WOF23398.1 2-phospho-L-lactate guanylyltransferase [Microbacterium sp. AB]